MKEKYTAVLSIHGIGRHRRYANAGALLNALEKVADSTLVQVRAGVESPRDPSLRADVPMLKLKRARRSAGKLSVGPAFRIYEVNWSPDTRARMPLRSMLTWTVALLTSTFRREPKNSLKWPRLRLARFRMTAERASAPAKRHSLAVLASAYRKYRGSLGGRHRAVNRGNSRFSDFMVFAKQNAGEAVTTSNLEASAKAWRDTRLPCEVSVRNAGRTALRGLLLLGLIAVAIVVPFVRDVNLSQFMRIIVPGLLATMTIALLVLASRFLTTVFSDVRYWSALNENDMFHETRNAVLERTVAMIRHVVSDPACVRVVIVAHSLGTAIAYDALRAIGLYNLAREDATHEQIEIRKVERLITLGSPIDKLALLFETTSARTFREELMREELRGDLNTGPFWVNGRQRIRWLNFWDPADPVSDPLYVPLGAEPLGDGFKETAIENIEVANTALFDPAGSHTKYLANPAVAARIFDEIFRQPLRSISGESTYVTNRLWSRRFVTLTLLGFLLLLITFTAAHFLSGWLITLVSWVSLTILALSFSSLLLIARRRPR